MQPRYQKSASAPCGSTYLGIWPFRACSRARASRLAMAPSYKRRLPLPSMPSAQMAASRPKMRV